MADYIKNISSPPCWPYVELKAEVKAIRQTMEERKETNERALKLAEDRLEKKLIEMNGIKAEVLSQAKEAALSRGEHKWFDALLSIILSGFVAGFIAYLVSSRSIG